MSDDELKNKSIEDLEHILKALEAQSRFTEMQIKEVKEELKGRKQVLPLGVPIKGTLNDIPYEAVSRAFIRWFACEASADKFEKYFVNFIKALQDIAEDKPIDIKVLLPLLKKGWVFYQGNINAWLWSDNKPTATNVRWEYEEEFYPIYGFNLKPADDWRNSLMECGL